MKYSLKELVDIQKLQELTDDLYHAAGIPSAIITMDGEILIGSGWQRICTDFHRKHPEIEKDCIESDIAIRKGIEAGEPFTMYTCPRGLTDASIPIVIEGQHVANAFAGQLFLEEPGQEAEQHFRQQARHYGMDEEAYIEAFREIPVFPIDRFRSALQFIAKLATMVGDMGLQRKLELEAKQELQTNEEKYRTLFENMSQGVFYQRADGSVVDCNQASLEMFGLTRDQFLGRTSMHPNWKVFDEDGNELTPHKHPSMQAFSTGKEIRDMTVAVFNPIKQGLVWLTTNATPQFHPGDNKPYQVFATMHDITERKNFFEAQQKSEARFLDISQSMDEWIWEVDAQGIVTFVSDKIRSILGYSPEEVIGKTPFDFMHTEEAKSVAGEFSEIIEKKGRIRDFENRNLTKDGRTIYMLTNGIPLLNDKGELVGYRGTNREITEKKQAEFQLLIERQFLEKAQEIGKIGIWELDVRKNELWWTDENYRIFGLPIGSTLSYQIFLDCVHPDDREYVDREWKDAFDKKPYDIEHRLLVDGKVKWVREKAELEFDDNGECIRGVGVTQDITERKQAQEYLRKSQSLLKNITDNMFDLVSTSDLHGKFMYVSPSHKTVLGYEQEDLVGREVLEFVHSEDLPLVAEKLAEVVGTQTQLSTEHRYKTAAGEYVWLESIGKVYIDDQGNPAGIIISSRNITKRKEMEVELKEASSFLRAAMDHSPAGIVIADAPDGKLRYVNDAALGIRGSSKDKVVDKVTIETYVESWQIRHFDGTPYQPDEVPLARAILYGETNNRQFVIHTGEEERVVWAYAAPIHDDEGKIIAGIVIFPDITELKRAEAEKGKLTEQLNQAQKMESIGRLAGGVAHDFNNLLTVIQGFSDLIQSSLSPDDPMKEDVTEIQRAADSAATLTNQLLAFSRKQIIAPKVLDLNRIILQSEKMLRRIIGEDIDFLFTPDDNIGKVLVDTGQIDQILVNLGVNSRDALPSGGKLTIETASVSFDEQKCHTCGNSFVGDFVMLEVRDNGIGMDAKTMQNIFEPFFTTKEMGKGTGLGLSTIHGIVLQNNGHIDVYSEPGQGTSFKIYFPIVHDQAVSNQKLEEPADTRGSGTILLVEDQDIVRKLALRVLQSKGYTVLEAQNGGVAFLKFENQGADIDLLLTDVVMPEMSGKELYERLSKFNPDLKVLFMSGYTDDAIAHHGILEEGINYIQKPFRPHELAAKVRQMLDN